MAQNVIKVAIVPTSSSTSLGTIRNCVGLNTRAFKRGFYQRQLLDVKEEGKQWVKGDEIVIGLYYKKCGCKESTYELLNENGNAFIYSN
jgi:hypothetical protein